MRTEKNQCGSSFNSFLFSSALRGWKEEGRNGLDMSLADLLPHISLRLDGFRSVSHRDLEDGERNKNFEKEMKRQAIGVIYSLLLIPLLL